MMFGFFSKPKEPKKEIHVHSVDLGTMFIWGLCVLGGAAAVTVVGANAVIATVTGARFLKWLSD